jgi:hypothetical protein
VLREVLFGFDLLVGTRVEEAKKLAEMLNEHVLDMFVTMRENNSRAAKSVYEQ